jgi:hypothetical protein
VDVNRQYRNDLTALMWAAGYGKADTVRLLLENGADPNLKDNAAKPRGRLQQTPNIRRWWRSWEVRGRGKIKEERGKKKGLGQQRPQRKRYAGKGGGKLFRRRTFLGRHDGQKR